MNQIDNALLDSLALNAEGDGVQQRVGAIVHFNGKVLPLQRPPADFMARIGTCRDRRIMHTPRASQRPRIAATVFISC
ncbi:hypothetical protein ABZV58_28925 [Nocardia sp. NPDC004654]|uniref:hypothetical protein n=1 Tax=Nocardia sp. NPDC004654 TaxID=3154776 RepID=UPI0033B8A6A2